MFIAFRHQTVDAVRTGGHSTSDLPTQLHVRPSEPRFRFEAPQL